MPGRRGAGVPGREQLVARFIDASAKWPDAQAAFRAKLSASAGTSAAP
jgi:hypothetical protein